MTQHLDKKNNPNHNYDNFSQSESLVEKYYQIYLGLDSKELPNVCYHQNKNNLAKFINLFPKVENLESEKLEVILEKNLDKILEYCQNFKFDDSNLRQFFQSLSSGQIKDLYQNTNIHFQKITHIINPTLDGESHFQEKKRIYLGILWFLIGYYICFMIHQIVKFPQFQNLQEAANNKLLIFLTCCFIYYDDILDTDILSVEDKKICLTFTEYFFNKIVCLELEDEIPNMNEIVSSYEKINNTTNNTSNNTSNNISNKTTKKNTKILDKTKNILQLGLEALQDIEKGNNQCKIEKIKIMKLFQELFRSEIKNSKIQKNKNNLNREQLIKVTIEKSQKSIFLILSCLVSESNINSLALELTYKFSFLSQLLDDLNDREIDNQENTHTLFTYPNFEKEIDNTIKYIWYIYNYLNSENIRHKVPAYLLLSNHYSNLLVFNYSISKNVNNQRLIRKEVEKFTLIKSADIQRIRGLKLEYIKKLGNFLFK